MSSIPSTSSRSRWGKVASAVAEGPFSRSRLYELASKHPKLFRKDGRSVVVDLDLLYQIPMIRTRAPIGAVRWT